MTNYWPRTIDTQQILLPGMESGEGEEGGGEEALKTSQMVFHSDIDQQAFMVTLPCEGCILS